MPQICETRRAMGAAGSGNCSLLGSLNDPEYSPNDHESQELIANKIGGVAPTAAHHLRIIGEASNRRTSRLAFTSFDKIRVDETPAYLIKGLIPRGGLIVVWGAPKCGKSFFVYDLAMHIALGWKYRGRHTRHGAVMYCALEGAEDFRHRIEAFRQRNLAGNSSKVPFYLMASPMSLVADHAELIASARAALGDTKPAAIVIDTLNRSLAGSESDDGDMGAYVKAADALRMAFDCAVIIIHHCGHEGTRPRGHSSLMGAADAQLAVKLDRAGKIIVTVEFLKCGLAGEEFPSRLEVVEIGKDVDGDKLTSCVIVPAEVSARARRESKLTKGAQIALAALNGAIAVYGEVLQSSNHIPQNVKTVTIDQWRDYAYHQGLSGSDQARARRLAFQRAHEALVAAKQVAVWEPYVWLT